MDISRGLKALAIFGLLGTACQPPSPDSASRSISALAAVCSEHHGFRPDNPGLPERALAAGEAAWSACFHEALDDSMGRGALGEAYRRLMAAHRDMAAAVADGVMERREMRRELRARLEAIATLEARERARVESMVEEGMEAERQAEWRRQLDNINRQEVERALLGR